jgi:hypothetical protein
MKNFLVAMAVPSGYNGPRFVKKKLSLQPPPPPAAPWAAVPASMAVVNRSRRQVLIASASAFVTTTMTKTTRTAHAVAVASDASASDAVPKRMTSDDSLARSRFVGGWDVSSPRERHRDVLVEKRRRTLRAAQRVGTGNESDDERSISVVVGPSAASPTERNQLDPNDAEGTDAGTNEDDYENDTSDGENEGDDDDDSSVSSTGSVSSLDTNG